MLGIAVAAVLFAAARGVIADLRHLSAGRLIYWLSLLGLPYKRFGIAAAIGAHTTSAHRYDLIVAGTNHPGL